MEQWQIEGLNRLEKRGYLPVFRDLVRSHTCAFWWFDYSLPVGESILHNGTVAFIDTGTEILGITADHVFEGYLSDKSTNPAVICQIGSVTVEPEKYIAYRNPECDLIAFELPMILVAGTHVTTHSPKCWPPPRAKKGELVVLGGYPGNRREEQPGVANFDFVSFFGRVTASSEDHFSLHLDIPNSHWPQQLTVGDKPDLGGASGGPVFYLREDPIERLEYAGVIYQASQDYELVLCRHAVQLLEQES